MERPRRIAVLLEPDSEAQPAFDAALTVAARCGARLDLLVCEFKDMHFGWAPGPAGDRQQFREALLAGHHERLGQLVARAAEAGVEARGEALWGTPFHEVALERLGTLRPDLVVKHSVYHNPIERTLFTGSDWHLIRDCPVPLLLAKDPARLTDQPVLVCVDPLHSHDKPAALDHRLLGAAATWAGAMGGEVHALHVFGVPQPVAVIGDAYVAAALATEESTISVEQARRALRELVAVHPEVQGRTRLRIGAASREIVDEAKSLGAGLVVMGVVSRRRLERWFVGSTAESVLDRLPCNVLVVRPEASA